MLFSIQKFNEIFYNSAGQLNLLAKILLALLIIALTQIVVGILTTSFDKLLMKKGSSIEGRQITVTKLLNNTIKYLIYFFCVVHVLDLFGVKTDKILATAGIGGVAIGFGAQFIIRDVISGLAIILENQFKGLRITKIRGFDGAIHLISNGQINTVTNLSKENQRIEVKMEVPIKYSLDQYAEIVNEISNELVDKYSDIVKKPELIGVTKMDKNSMTITIWGSCKPESQYLYQREIIKKFIEKAKSKSMDLNCYFVAGDENEI